jgi:hypothetical protein
LGQFLRFEPRLRDLLGDYDPSFTSRAYSGGRLSSADIEACVPGQTRGADAQAILRWARLLDREDSFYGGIGAIAQNIEHFARGHLHRSLVRSRLPLLLVATLAGADTGRTLATIRDQRRSLLLHEPKTPGMGYVLGAEFLRDLHWGAFKPDRHIRRLFQLWYPSGLERFDGEVRALQALLGSNSSDLASYLRFSILGIEATPRGTPVTYADNLVWLLAAYIEKKGGESTTVYVSG